MPSSTHRGIVNVKLSSATYALLLRIIDLGLQEDLTTPGQITIKPGVDHAARALYQVLSGGSASLTVGPGDILTLTVTAGTKPVADELKALQDQSLTEASAINTKSRAQGGYDLVMAC